MLRCYKKKPKNLIEKPKKQSLHMQTSPDDDL